MSQPAIASALLVTQHYWPEPIGSAPYVTDLAEYLVARGTEVQVFTCRPHYPRGRVPDSYRRGRHDRQLRHGVGIVRVAPLQPQRRGALGRLAREGAFMLQGLWALATRRIRRSPVVVSLCPSILTVLLGVVARSRGGRHVVLVHDIQSGLAHGLGMIGRYGVVGLMRWLERVALNRADVVLVLSENMRTALQNQGVRTPIEILPIWVDTHTIRPFRVPSEDNLTAVYSGNLGKKQGLGQIVEMAELLERRGSPIDFLLRGEGGEADWLAQEVSARGLSRVRFAPLVPPEHLSTSLAEGAIHLVPQDPKAADFAVPSKAYAIMASGRPFVAAARPGSQLWDLKARSEAFLCVPAGDTRALADAVERLARNPVLRMELGRNGRRYVVDNHDKALVLERFINIAAIRRTNSSWHPQASHIS